MTDTRSPLASGMSASRRSIISPAISSAVRSLPRQTPGSPWMPMPISISSSAISKVGLPACGTVQGLSAAPMDRQASAAFWATAVTASRSWPCSAAAPAILNA
jgi:hypothetical protein